MAIDVGVDLHPERQVVGELSRELLLAHPGNSGSLLPLQKIQNATCVGEVLPIDRIVEDPVVAFALGEVGSGLELRKHSWDDKPLAAQSSEARALPAWDVEVPFRSSYTNDAAVCFQL